MTPAMINPDGITFSESAAPQLMSQMQRRAKFCEAARLHGGMAVISRAF
jgi:hypothetical protein